MISSSNLLSSNQMLIAKKDMKVVLRDSTYQMVTQVVVSSDNPG